MSRVKQARGLGPLWYLANILHRLPSSDNAKLSLKFLEKSCFDCVPSRLTTTPAIIVHSANPFVRTDGLPTFGKELYVSSTRHATSSARLVISVAWRLLSRPFSFQNFIQRTDAKRRCGHVINIPFLDRKNSPRFRHKITKIISNFINNLIYKV